GGCPRKSSTTNLVVSSSPAEPCGFAGEGTVRPPPPTNLSPPATSTSSARESSASRACYLHELRFRLAWELRRPPPRAAAAAAGAGRRRGLRSWGRPRGGREGVAPVEHGGPPSIWERERVEAGERGAGVPRALTPTICYPWDPLRVPRLPPIQTGPCPPSPPRGRLSGWRPLLRPPPALRPAACLEPHRWPWIRCRAGPGMVDRGRQPHHLLPSIRAEPCSGSVSTLPPLLAARSRFYRPGETGQRACGSVPN
ncbi:unnamed protein product, partial [Urochloa humidicola]